MCIHTYVRTYIHTYIHTYIRPYLHTYIHTYTYMHTYIHTYIHTLPTYMHTYIHTYIRTYIHMCVCVYVSGLDLETEVCWNKVASVSFKCRLCRLPHPTTDSVLLCSYAQCAGHSLWIQGASASWLGEASLKVDGPLGAFNSFTLKPNQAFLNSPWELGVLRSLLQVGVKLVVITRSRLLLLACHAQIFWLVVACRFSDS